MRSGSLKIGTFFGIGVYVHWTFLLLIAYVGGTAALGENGARGAVASVVLVVLVFVCVLMHEYGHALTARRFGVATRDITLLPIGGVARLERMPREPVQELLVALAGPAVNVVIALVLIPIVVLIGSFRAALDTGVGALDVGTLLAQLLLVNIALVVFNLIPAFPMDGGRVLRALLAMRLPYARATRLAATIGQVLAGAFAIVGVLGGNLLLVLIGLFVWVGGGAEAKAAEEQAGLGHRPVRDGMLTRFRTLGVEDSLDDALRALLAGSQPDFPVVGGGATIGVLSRQDLLRGLASLGGSGRVSQAMRRDVILAAEGDPLARAMDAMRAAGAALVVVERAGEIVGILTPENVAELLLAHEALARHAGRSF